MRTRHLGWEVDRDCAILRATRPHCYVIEFKLGTTAVSAVRQIKANHYAERFAGNGKTLTLIGLAFSKAKRTIVAAKVEEVA